MDLKVTFFPAEYMVSLLSDKLGNKELTWLKKQSEKFGIMSDKNLTDREQLAFLKEELHNQGHKEIVDTLNSKRKEVVDEVRKQPEGLIRWLYENQSQRLFGAENRLFLVMVDSSDMSKSWQMKRAFSLIEPSVNDYLNRFDEETLRKITFKFNNKEYTSLSDIIFIVR